MASLRRFSPADIEKLKFMASFGHDGKSIARALDRTPQAVRVKAVEIGVRLRPPKMDHRRIKLSTQAWRALQTEADRLGTSAGRLARLVVETVARDKLVSAVIDAPVEKRRSEATCHPAFFATLRIFDRSKAARPSSVCSITCVIAC